MKRSNLRIRTFIPSVCFMPEHNHKDDELFATLSYGNVSIEIPETYIRSLKLERGDISSSKTVSLFHSGLDQISHDMQYDREGFIHPYHRDGDKFDTLPMSHNPLHRKEPKDIGRYVFYNEKEEDGKDCPL